MKAPLPQRTLTPLLLAAVWAMLAASVRGDMLHAPSARSSIPDDLGPVQSIQGRPQAQVMYRNLKLSYEDYRAVKTRPLLHLEPKDENEPSPQLLIFGAFLDTRPMYYNKGAVLRVMALKYEPEKETNDPQVYCKFLAEGQDSYFVSKAHGPLHVNTNGKGYTDVIYTCATDIASIAMVEEAADQGRKVGRLPRFVTLVAHPEQEVTYQFAWVHVSSVPLVHDNAAHVNKALIAAREPEKGPFLSPAHYKSGDGDIAVCVQPMYGGNFAAAIIPEWAEFQKMMGVSKVMLYDFQTGPLTRHFMNMYQAEGLFEVYDFILSKRLLVPGAENSSNFCNERFTTDIKRHGLMSPEWVSNCTGRMQHYRVFINAESVQRMHCLYSTMARYRWVAFHDVDEYLTPRVQPPVNWTMLFKQAMADSPSNFARYGFQHNETLDSFKNDFNISKTPFPMSFIFSNTFVCTFCIAGYHLSPANATINRDQIVSVVPPDPHLSAELRTPKPSMHPVTWSVIRDEIHRPLDRSKAISDPLAIMTHGGHVPWTYWYMEGGSLPIPTSSPFLLSEDVALLYHVRVSHVSSPQTLKAIMDPVKRNELFNLEQCIDHNSCGGPYVWRSPKLFEDWTLTNLYGARLVEAIHERFHVSTLHGMSADTHHKR